MRSQQKKSRPQFYSLLTCLLGFALFVGSSTAMAQSSGSQEKVQVPQDDEKSDKVDISDLENKYWAPKDTDFSVVQNRTYSKDKRFAASVAAGILINDSYTEGQVYSLQGSYFLSERYGVNLNYESFGLDDNEVVTSFQSFAAGQTTPNYGKALAYYGAGFSWIPFYAKMSVLGKKIVYFDMALTPVLGMTEYEQQLYDQSNPTKTSFTYGFDITQYFFISRFLTLRFDYKNRWYNEEVLQYRGTGGNTPLTGTKVQDQVTNTSILQFGVMFLF